MRVLIVGAGAVGQVYGHHLSRGGAEVAFLVKPKYAAACKAGMTLYRLGIGRKPAKEQLKGYQVLTDTADVRQSTWDYVILTVATPALAGEWLEDLLGAIGDASLIALQPGIAVQERILGAWHTATDESPDKLGQRLITGLISLIAYQAPLPGETFDEPGIAFWLPPMSALPFSGDPNRTAPIIATMTAGGCRSRFIPDLQVQAVMGSAMMMPQIAALEACGWSFAALRKDPLMAIACRASRQMIEIAAKHQGFSVPGSANMAQPWLFKLILAVGPAIVPLPFEPYLKYHFTKVGEQTRAMLTLNLGLGEQHGLPTDAIRALAGKLQVV